MRAVLPLSVSLSIEAPSWYWGLFVRACTVCLLLGNDLHNNASDCAYRLKDEARRWRGRKRGAEATKQTHNGKGTLQLFELWGIEIAYEKEESSPLCFMYPKTMSHGASRGTSAEMQALIACRLLSHLLILGARSTQARFGRDCGLTHGKAMLGNQNAKNYAGEAKRSKANLRM